MTNDRALANSGQNAMSIYLDDQWIEGFISALNSAYQVEGFGGSSGEVVLSEVEAYCVAHPQATIAAAAAEIFDRNGRPATPLHLEQ